MYCTCMYCCATQSSAPLPGKEDLQRTECFGLQFDAQTFDAKDRGQSPTATFQGPSPLCNAPACVSHEIRGPPPPHERWLDGDVGLSRDASALVQFDRV